VLYCLLLNKVNTMKKKILYRLLASTRSNLVRNLVRDHETYEVFQNGIILMCSELPAVAPNGSEAA